MIVVNGNRLPDVFIVGAAKSGTTSLYQMLAQHPAVYFPPSKKEPFFFCFGNERPDYLDPSIINQVIWKEQAYFNLYKDAPSSSVAVDASTSYLYKHDVVIPNMRKYYGSEFERIKIIILLRNPVERAWSHYNFLIRNGFEKFPFSEAIKPEVMAERSAKRWGFDYLGYGTYASQVDSYKRHFADVKVYLTEDFMDYKNLLKDVHDFMGVEAMEVRKAKQANPSGIPKNKMAVSFIRKNAMLKKLVNLLPEQQKHSLLEKRDRLMSKMMDRHEMPSALKMQLIEHYAEDLLRLEAVIGRDLSKWREK